MVAITLAPRNLNLRRIFVTIAIAAVALALAGIEGARADAAANFMKQVSRDLIAANKARSPGAFERAVRRYGDVGGIGLYSLGTYRARLDMSDRSTYLSGMVRFVSRYAAQESAKYRVVKAEILGPGNRTRQGVSIDTRVYLADGNSYDVTWLLVPVGKTFRIRDAQVMGFWMTPFLKNLFEGFIGENGGNPKALVVALSR